MQNNKYYKFFRLSLFVEMALCVVFTFFSLSFKLDVSILAFPIALIFTAFMCYFGFVKVLKRREQKYFYYTLKFVQYVPTLFIITFILQRAGVKGKPYWLDFVCAVLWILVLLFSFILQYLMSDKRSDKLGDVWEVKSPKRKKPIGLGRLVFEIVDWIDALLQVVFLVFIFQIFTFQLYVIPSESMVPEFLIKDRVVVEKINCGPKFPLSDVGLPDFTDYKRGDIVVLRNPHYTLDHKSEVKTVTSQMIYMLTFMGVNLNKDDNGQLKADPLVKRIVGEEGEQLVMQDGVLYKRTKDSNEFKPIPANEDFACWNLNANDLNLKKRIQSFPLSEDEYKTLLAFEDERREYDLDSAAELCKYIASNLDNFTSSEKAGTFTAPDLKIYDLFNSNYELAIHIMTQKGGTEWFANFITSWIPSKDNERDVYSESNFKLNAMAKTTLASIVYKNAQLIKEGVSSIVWATDPDLKKAMDLAGKIIWYVQGNEYMGYPGIDFTDIPGYLDLRNMPVFPANDGNGNPVYIPEDCYFMMGDNRFNSLDLRHSTEKFIKPLAESDPSSITYLSYMQPQYLNKKYIIGKPIFRFLPKDRIGKINKRK